MDQLLGYVQNETVLGFFLKKYLYGLKQAPLLGMQKLTTFLLTLDFLDAIMILMSIPRK
jgi:hypothetical protein